MTQTPQSNRYAIAVVSGGLDSVTMMYDLVSQGYQVDMLSFNYGQRHKKELYFAAVHAQMMDLKHDIVDLTGLTHLISNSALTSDGMPYEGTHDIEVPDGHYAEETMKLTVVPNRNMIMLSIAAGVAINRKATTVAAAMHSGDHFIYPDCRPQFIFALGQALLAGNEGFHNFNLDEPVEVDGRKYGAAMPLTTPYLYKSKADIAYKAFELGVPLHLTWSCYKGGDNHCGRCGTCVERLEAIDAAKFSWAQNDPDFIVEDTTYYDDTEFWKTATAKENVDG